MKLNEIVRAEPQINVTLTALDIKILYDILGNRHKNSPRHADYDYDQEFELYEEISRIKEEL